MTTTAEAMAAVRKSLLAAESARSATAAMLRVARGGDAAATAMRDLIQAQLTALQTELTAAATTTAALLELVATPPAKPAAKK